MAGVEGAVTTPARWSDRLLGDLPLTAASFIVTVYGDIVVPRGEVLWMGSLIDICGRVGINESLVRTATSRLVTGGQLDGERSGRRSFYRLGSDARTEFAQAARLLYTDQVQPERWNVLHLTDVTTEDIRRYRMARMGGDVWVCPDLGDGTPAADLVLRVETPPSVAELIVLARFWDLSGLQERYKAMLGHFRHLSEAMRAGQEIAADDALICRLLLVHAYRNVLLRDPCLPAVALPPDWRGLEARKLFRSLYTALSSVAEEEIGRTLEGKDGPLPVRTKLSEARLTVLAEVKPSASYENKTSQK